jgi:hypothetical protein
LSLKLEQDSDKHDFYGDGGVVMVPVLSAEVRSRIHNQS